MKYFIVFFLVNYLIQDIVGFVSKEQKTCISTIKAYFNVEPKKLPRISYYANYAMLHFRKAEDSSSRIKIVPSDIEFPQNILQLSEETPNPPEETPKFPQNNQTIPKKITKSHIKVFNLEDLMTSRNEGETSSNTPEISSTEYTQVESIESSQNIIVDYFNIPDDVKNFYFKMIPYLIHHSHFKTPSQYCSSQYYFKTVEYAICNDQVTEIFGLKDVNDPDVIVQKLFEGYTIGELNKKTQNYGREYMCHVLLYFKLNDALTTKMPLPGNFCKNTYPTR